MVKKVNLGQLAFGRDMIMRVKQQANWRLVWIMKKKKADENWRQENLKQIKHIYRIGNMVLIGHVRRKLKMPYEGPYKIVQLFHNGAV